MRWLDLFRGLAAILVVVYHFDYRFHLPHLNFGYIAVDWFFVLSGIVLFKRYDELISKGGISAFDFAWHRIRRLYPMVGLTVVALLSLKLGGILPIRPQYETSTILRLLTVWPYGSHAGFAESFPADGVMWSLMAEFLMNAVWFAALRWGRLPLLVMFGLSIVAAIYFAFRRGSFDYGMMAGAKEAFHATVRALAGFGIGCWIAYRRPFAKVHWAVPLTALLLLCAYSQKTFMHSALLDLAIILCGAVLLATLMHSEPRSASVRGLCTYLGMLSFPLYLIHPASRDVADFAAAHGMKSMLTFVLVPLVFGAIATFINEKIIDDLPRDLNALPLAAGSR